LLLAKAGRLYWICDTLDFKAKTVVGEKTDNNNFAQLFTHRFWSFTLKQIQCKKCFFFYFFSPLQSQPTARLKLIIAIIKR